MKLELSDIYIPITSAPFRNNSEYCEIEPCEALKPYIRCFWGTPDDPNASPPDENYDIVIPDTCMDIIYSVNREKRCVESVFCALDERPAKLPERECFPGNNIFAIRFYVWSAALFSEDTFAGSKNGRYPADAFFYSLTKKLKPVLLEKNSLSEIIEDTEKILFGILSNKYINNDFMNTLYRIISMNGTAKISDLTSYAAVSEKTLERLFAANAGVSPKTLCTLVRYQLLWQDMILNVRFNSLDAVEKYGYFDQAHMLNDFRRRHLMNPAEAVLYARTRQ